jgi:hypothetical protein
VAGNLFEELFAFRSGDGLGIAHPRDMARRVEYDSSGHDRAGETSPADLVDTRDVTEADSAQRVLQGALSWDPPSHIAIGPLEPLTP